jgi:predicted nucleic acid-binding protein
VHSGADWCRRCGVCTGLVRYAPAEDTWLRALRGAARHGTLVALAVEANRDPKPRRMDLMIAAIASTRGLPLYTRNSKDLVGLADMIHVVEV